MITKCGRKILKARGEVSYTLKCVLFLVQKYSAREKWAEFLFD